MDWIRTHKKSIIILQIVIKRKKYSIKTTYRSRRYVYMGVVNFLVNVSICSSSKLNGKIECQVHKNFNCT